MKAAVPLPSIKRFESGSTSEDFFRKMPSKIVRHGVGKMGFDMEQADGVNRCLSSFSIYASLQSVTHNFMPHHRNGCRARSRVPHVPRSIQLASQELLAQGAFKVLSQTLEDAKKQMLPFILLQLTRKGCSKGLAFQIWLTVKIAFHKPSLDGKQKHGKFNWFWKAINSNSAGNNLSRAGSKLGWWSLHTEPITLVDRGDSGQ